MADTEIALPYTWGAASVSDAVDAGTLQPSKTASASKQTASLLRSNQSLGSTGGSGSLLQRQGLNNRSAEATLLPSKSASSGALRPLGAKTRSPSIGFEKTWRHNAQKDAVEVGTAFGGAMGRRCYRFADTVKPVIFAAKLKHAQTDGHIGRLRDIVSQALCSERSKDTASLETLQQAKRLVDIAERCSRECRDGLANDNVFALRRAVRKMQFMVELGPRKWEDEWLAQGRERCRAVMRRHKAELEAELGHTQTQTLQKARYEELKIWLQDQELQPSCDTIHFGPGAPGTCSECTSCHFWFCHGCCCVQYGMSIRGTCMHGCDPGALGWTCVGSRCAGQDCGCQLGDAFWLASGCICAQEDLEITETGEEPRSTAASKASLPDFASMTLRELIDFSRTVTAVTWQRMVSPAPEINRSLIDRCKAEGVSAIGTWEVKAQRINWKVMMRGEGDAFDDIRAPASLGLFELASDPFPLMYLLG